MFLTNTRTLFVEAFKRTFDADYPVEQYRSLGDTVILDFPMAEAQYPGVLVDFTPGTEMQVAGIGHIEFGPPGADGSVRSYSRWRFTGYVTFTFFALGSLERDEMVDEFIRVLAFGVEEPATSEFRTWIETNDLIGLSVNWDRIGLTGKAESQGTPWGTDEWIYEQTVQIEVGNGEFVSQGSSHSLIPLSAIQHDDPYVTGEADPFPGDGWQ